MPKAIARCFLLCVLAFNRLPASVNGQRMAATLQPGQPIERTISGSEVHSYSVHLDQNQFLQLVVDQRGVDVVVRVIAPDGKSLGEFDSPNGDSGPENV